MGTEDVPQMQRVVRTRAEARRSYDRLSRIYDLLVASGERRYRAAGLAALAVEPGEMVLEIGFGTGLCLVELAHAVGSVGRLAGIDLSPGMLAIAQERLQKAGLAERVALQTGDATALPFPAAEFDALLMSFTLELFDQAEFNAVLSECRRVLKPGGRLVVVALSRAGKVGLMTRLYEWGHNRFPALLDCRPIYARYLLEQAGFTIVSSQLMAYWGLQVEVVRGEVDLRPG